MLSNSNSQPEAVMGFPTACRALDKPLVSILSASKLEVCLGAELQQVWRTDTGEKGDLTLVLEEDRTDGGQLRRLSGLAALEKAFAQHPEQRAIKLSGTENLSRLLLQDGTALRIESDILEVAAERLWQQSDLWLCSPGNDDYVQQFTMTDGRYHPRRAPKPRGTVYARHIPWLDRTLSFRVVDMEQDLERFHRWMNDPRVAQFWQEEGDLLKHRSYLEGQLADPHFIPLIGCFDGLPFGYFEVYWAKENRIGAYYDAGDYDRGWHVLIGEDNVRGRAWITAWLPSLAHYMFLDDRRTQRIVGEPRADHHQQIRNLDKSGFAKIKEFDFPHKRAMLVMLLRERFFGDRLWVPKDGHQDGIIKPLD